MKCNDNRELVTLTLKELGTFKNGANFDCHDYGEGCPLIGVKDLFTGRYVDISNLESIKLSTGNELKNLRLRRGDILFVRSYANANGVGRAAMVGDCPDNAVYSGFVIRFRLTDSSKVNPLYLVYLLQSKATRRKMIENALGTSINSINQKILGNLELYLPSRNEQDAIVGVIGSIDDKIELNQRMNKTIELMAGRIFKSWFIDFDPVRAKIEGKRPFGMDEETAALFPSEFEESELGAIPKGWSIRTIGEMADVVGGSTPSTKEPTYWDGEYYFVTPKDMSTLESPFVLGSERRITVKGLECISSGLLPAGTVLLSSRAPIGYLAITEVPVSINQGIIAMVPNGQLPSSYLLFWTENNMDTIINNANGTTFQEISKSNFRPIKLVVPPHGIVERFEAIVAPLNAMIGNNLKETATLTALRDALLPKLLSGELCVADMSSDNLIA